MVNNNFKVGTLLGMANSPNVSDAFINEAGETVSYNISMLFNVFDKFMTYANTTTPNVIAVENNNTACSILGFGTSDTPESVDDITLTDFADNSNFTLLSGSRTQMVTGRHYNTFTEAFRYDGANPVTIREVGLFWKPTAQPSVKVIMIAREVLDQPITVSNGDTFSVTMAIG